MPYQIPRCRVIPLPDYQASFEIDGRERLRWHFGAHYPRPFFYPLVGPSDATLTRMGHPGDAGHDHHRSLWFAHAKVDSEDYWSDRTKTHIKQQRWLRYRDGEDEAVMASLMHWINGQGSVVMEQTLVAAVRPKQGETGEGGETFIELQSTFTPRSEQLTLEKTNFGLLAVRVASNLAAHFGGGKIRNARGAEDESNIFGLESEWMDYSGPTTGGQIEGITYFDHPANAGYPSKWHVREDGWMGASLCRDEDRVLSPTQPLVVRYLLHAHAGDLQPQRAARAANHFAHTPAYEVVKANVKHQHYEVRRRDEA